jgi:glucoamylase
LSKAGAPLSLGKLHGNGCFGQRLLFLIWRLAAPAFVRGQVAPGAPGATPTWTPGSTEAVGTSTSADSHVWFTLEGGVLTEVYYPRLDSADVRSLQFAVSDGKTVWIESKDMLHSLFLTDENALAYRQISRDPAGHFRISKTYATDSRRDTLLIDVTFSASPAYSLYVLYEPSPKNSGYGDTGYSEGDALIASKQDVASALLSSSGFRQMSNGFAGTSDGYTDLLLHHQLAWSYPRAENGNVIQTAKLDGAHVTLALGFGATPASAVESARTSLKAAFYPSVRTTARGGMNMHAFYVM